MNKKILGITTLVMGLAISTTAMAATWRTGAQPNQDRWWYDMEDGSYAQNEWRWLDGDNDGVAECYAFDGEGWMYANTVTPDGFQVNEDGAWVVDGVVQTQVQTGGQTGQTDQAAQTNNGSRVLVAYYTLPETDGTDTDSGASRVVTGGQVQGNVEFMANIIRDASGADIFRIDTVETYPTIHQPLVNQASDEQDRNFRPTLSARIENLDDYDVIFVGYPNWWGDMPMAMYSFFEGHDFGGKTIIPFTAHGGSGFSSSLSDIAQLEPNATISQSRYSVERNRVASDEQNIRNWVNGLNL